MQSQLVPFLLSSTWGAGHLRLQAIVRSTIDGWSRCIGRGSTAGIDAIDMNRRLKMDVPCRDQRSGADAQCRDRRLGADAQCRDGRLECMHNAWIDTAPILLWVMQTRSTCSYRVAYSRPAQCGGLSILISHSKYFASNDTNRLNDHRSNSFKVVYLENVVSRFTGVQRMPIDEYQQ